MVNQTINSLARFLFITIAGTTILYFGKPLFIPILYGLFTAIVLYPVCRWLEGHSFSRVAAIFVSLSGVLISGGLLVWLLVLQLNTLGDYLPELNEKIRPAVSELQHWMSDNFGIPIASQNHWWAQSLSKISDNALNVLSYTFSNTMSGIFMLVVVPVYAILFLYSRRQFVFFLQILTGPGFQHQLGGILSETILTYFHFIKGMVLVYIIVGILNSIGLLMLGIDHAVLFGFLTAVMTIIPYLGIFIAGLLPVTVAWLTKDSIWYPVGVIMIFAFVQYLEANLIFPKVVAKQLNVSTWATFTAIIAGGILWGANGMILFMPLLAMLKILSEHIPAWQPLTVLLSRNSKPQ